MHANFDITPGFLNNEAEFKDPFFSQFELRPMPKPLELSEGVQKQYKFPTFYTNVTCSMGVFFCDFKKAKSILPDPDMTPLSMLKGRALVLLGCYQYRSVYNIKPYNEIAMTIPVFMGKGMNLPVVPMVVPKFKNFGYYVFGMPVTSKENQIRGNKIWGLPKVTHTIDITQKDGVEETIAREPDGTPYFTLKVPMVGTPTRVRQSANIFSKLDGNLLKSPTCFEGQFKIQKFMKRLFEPKMAPGETFPNSCLTIGNTPSAKILASLDIDPRPFQFRYSDRVSSIFDLPTQF